MRFVWIWLFVAALTLAPTMAGQAGAQDNENTIVDVAAAAGSFDTLLAAVEAAGLTDTLAGDGPFTVFAPTDDAFAALPDGTLESLLDDPEGALTKILLYHVIDGAVYAEDVVALAGSEVQTLGGESVSVNVDGDRVLINDANVSQVDVGASNGVIHVIDSVLIPPSSDDTDADVGAVAEEESGVDRATDDGAETSAAVTEADIVDTALSAGNFSTLVAAVQAAGLEETLRGDGPFTVFAPTDDAFAALPPELLESLLAEPEGALTDILLYHVVAGKVLAVDVLSLDGAAVETVGGESFTVTVGDDGIFVDAAEVIATDVAATNGVIHVIDSVLLPSAVSEAIQAPAPKATSARGLFPRQTESAGKDDGDTKDKHDTYESRKKGGWYSEKSHSRTYHGRPTHGYSQHDTRHHGSHCR